jgi:hypothetical protein
VKEKEESGADQYELPQPLGGIISNQRDNQGPDKEYP